MQTGLRNSRCIKRCKKNGLTIPTALEGKQVFRNNVSLHVNQDVWFSGTDKDFEINLSKIKY